MHKIVQPFWPGTYSVKEEKKKAPGERNVIMVHSWMSVHWKIFLKSHPMSLPDYSSKVENRKCYTFSLIDHTLAQLSNRRAEAISGVTRAFDFFVPQFWFFSYSLLYMTPCVYSDHFCTHIYMCILFCSLLFVSLCWISWASGERRRRNQYHGHWLLSEHICLPAALVFTPDPSQVTVWVALSLSTSCYLCPPPLPKVFLPNIEETLQPQLKRAAVAFCASPQSHTRHQVDPGRATIKDWLDLKVIKTNLRFI